LLLPRSCCLLRSLNQPRSSPLPPCLPSAAHRLDSMARPPLLVSRLARPAGTRHGTPAVGPARCDLPLASVLLLVRDPAAHRRLEVRHSAAGRAGHPRPVGVRDGLVAVPALVPDALDPVVLPARAQAAEGERRKLQGLAEQEVCQRAAWDSAPATSHDPATSADQPRPSTAGPCCRSAQHHGVMSRPSNQGVRFAGGHAPGGALGCGCTPALPAQSCNTC
jgi:hypothetical protein